MEARFPQSLEVGLVRTPEPKSRREVSTCSRSKIFSGENTYCRDGVSQRVHCTGVRGSGAK